MSPRHVVDTALSQAKELASLTFLLSTGKSERQMQVRSLVGRWPADRGEGEGSHSSPSVPFHWPGCDQVSSRVWLKLRSPPGSGAVSENRVMYEVPEPRRTVAMGRKDDTPTGVPSLTACGHFRKRPRCIPPWLAPPRPRTRANPKPPHGHQQEGLLLIPKGRLLPRKSPGESGMAFLRNSIFADVIHSGSRDEAVLDLVGFFHPATDFL